MKANNIIEEKSLKFFITLDTKITKEKRKRAHKEVI